MSPLPRVLERQFSWIKELGRGGAATVHHVRCTRDGSEVALKLMDEASHLPDGLARFVSEFEWLRLGTSRFVVRVFDTNLPRPGVGAPPPGPVWFTMELCRGSWTHMAKVCRYNAEERLQWCENAMEGLCTIHDRGLAHRDLKMGNLLVGRDGRAKLADLGISLRAFGKRDGGTHSAVRITDSKERLGSDFYLAPERFDEHRRPRSAHEPEYWFLSDQYSLAVCLYLLLSPAGDRHPYGTPQRALAEPMPEFLGLSSELPSVATVLARMLQIEPAKRYPNMQEALADFRYNAGKDVVKARGFARGVGTLHRTDDTESR